MDLGAPQVRSRVIESGYDAVCQALHPFNPLIHLLEGGDGLPHTWVDPDP